VNGGANQPPAGCVSALSCEELQRQFSTSWPYATPSQPSTAAASVCGESDAGLIDDDIDDELTCFGGEGWPNAASICFEAGARLCTLDELMTGVGWGTGCGHNQASVWAMDQCVGGHMANTGHVPSQQECAPDASGLAVRCCADSADARAGEATCDSLAADLQSECTSTRSCAELAGASTDSPCTGWDGCGQQDPNHADCALDRVLCTADSPPWDQRRFGSHTVCGESDALLGPGSTNQCDSQATWHHAESVCLSAGSRLCTAEEIAAGEIRATGCDNTARLIWTSDRATCGAGEHVVARASPYTYTQLPGVGWCTDSHNSEGTARRFEVGTLPVIRALCSDDPNCVAFAFRDDPGGHSALYTTTDCTRGCENTAWVDNTASIVGTSGAGLYACCVKEAAAGFSCEHDDTGNGLACCADDAKKTRRGVPCTAQAEHSTSIQTAPCMSASTCESLQERHSGWTCSRTRPNVCGEGNAGLSVECGDESTHLEAEAQCFEAGARLCTALELFVGVVTSQCGSQTVWSASECTTGHISVDYSAREDASQGQACVDDSTTNHVNCCADGEASRSGLMVCDLYASEEGGCTSTMSCVALNARDGGSSWPDAHNDGVCAESDAGLGPGNTEMCWGGPDRSAVSWQQAETVCVGAGARLCSVEEIEANEAQNTGCGFDHIMVWASDDTACGEGQHVVVIGSTEDGDVDSECRDDAGQAHEAVRCCADTVVGVPCTLNDPHGTTVDGPPPPPIDVSCSLAWDTTAHSSCSGSGSCAACEQCFTTPRLDAPGFCGCFETEQGGPGCTGSFSRCSPCGQTCGHCVQSTIGAPPLVPQQCGAAGDARCPKHSRCESQPFRQVPGQGWCTDAAGGEGTARKFLHDADLDTVKAACLVDESCVGISFHATAASVLYTTCVDTDQNSAGCDNTQWLGEGKALIVGTSGTMGYTCWTRNDAGSAAGICL
jgi:hypothetical protein